MCNQTVCLVAAELERRGITTVVIQLLRDVAVKVRPPRALFVPFEHGYPVDRPGAPERQHRVLEAALRLVEDATSEPPMLVDFESEAPPPVQGIVEWACDDGPDDRRRHAGRRRDEPSR